MTVPANEPVTCPFCVVDPAQLFHEGTLVRGLWDAYPVSPGHALLVPIRHVESWFAASSAEQAELLRALELAKEHILSRHQPDGFNIGINVGPVAGQTIPHLHVHLIPRYHGDVTDPRGGVRHVIPKKANYLQPSAAGLELLADLPHSLALVRGDSDPLLPHLRKHLDQSVAADMAVAFVLRSGVLPLIEHVRDLLARGGTLRLLTGDYLDVTDPDALMLLLDLPGRTELRVFETRITSFHPKSYLLRQQDGRGIAYVGSSNLTATALGPGLEWNYRVVSSRDASGFNDVADAFEQLFRHPATRPLTADWVAAYRLRRQLAPIPRHVEVIVEPPALPPEPHSVQREALAALQQTRVAGNAAGLVVLATGLGKTWLSAFDSQRPEFRRVLFVAHRDEILTQAMNTFRRMRPAARLGKYNGEEKAADADVLFASIQTLSRRHHLDRFEPDQFDYLVVDEFHHAAAATYRRLIEYFSPRFLLGLTATPERTDGGDLMSLCQENLVYRCDLPDGIGRELLCPFSYFGVPDEIDYRNIPWRNSRFDEEALTLAVATQKRAANVLDQYRQRAGRRTLAFCCSQRHAEFQAAYFRDQGFRAVAVHSDPGSAPRAASLEQLDAGSLDVICAVDLFNEGVDLPNIDTVMMLRPTESRIVWLQQLGRGLRRSPGKDRLRVIDYIGNHRSFLIKPRTLFNLGSGDAEVAFKLRELAAGEATLPLGCEVTYDLKAIEILRSLLRSGSGPQLIQAFHEDFRERHGVRPRAAEVVHEGYNPRVMRPAFGSWLRFVAKMGDLTEGQRRALEAAEDFLTALENTPLTKSFKLLTLQAMLAADALPGQLSLSDLADRVQRLAHRSAVLRQEFGTAIDDSPRFQQLLKENPIAAWIGGRGTEGGPFFSFENGLFASRFEVPQSVRGEFQELAHELIEWRMAEYLRRPSTVGMGDGFDASVSQSGGRPIIFLPDRKRVPGVPQGWVDLAVDGELLRANFVKVAVNVIHRPADADTNLLPNLLRRWFGTGAGMPGTSHRVRFTFTDEMWSVSPASQAGGQVKSLEQWRHYLREEIPPLFGLSFNTAIWNAGFVKQQNHLFLLVTLEKEGMHDTFQYEDRFLAPDLFQWQSQNRTAQGSTAGQALRHHKEQGLKVHLFVRRTKKVGAKASPFIYCGDVSFVDWRNSAPITFTWRLTEPVPEALRSTLLLDPNQPLGS